MRIGRLSRLWPTQRRRDAAECRRCRTSFVFSPGHATVAETPLISGRRYWVAPLCEPCWRELSPAERLVYYADEWRHHHGPDPQENRLVWAAIEAAVLTGA